MGSYTRTLFIGVDAGDKELILHWARAGELPTFRRLFDEAAWATTVNPPALFVGSIWPSFYTSLSPTKHGRYCFNQLRSGTYETPKFLPSQTKGSAFWSVLGQAGKKVAVIDIPKSTLDPSLNGMQVVDWVTHDPDEGFRTQPPSLTREIENKYGLDPIGICDGKRQSAADFKTFRDKLLQRVRMKEELSSSVLGQGGWDAFLTTFTESHCVGHQCWHLWDKTHPRYDAALAAEVGNPILEVYRAIDAAIGRLWEKVGPETPLIVLASHGMGPHYEATFFFNEILKKLDRRFPAAASGSLSLKEIARRLWHVIPRSIRQHLFKDLKQQLNKEADGRRYYQVPNNDVHAGVRINKIGREPKGCVSSDEFETVRDELITDLMGLKNAESGEPLVLGVHRIEDLYPGLDTSALPDLVLEWNRSKPIRAAASPKIGRIEGDYEGCRTGDHKSSGLFFAAGPPFTKGRLPQAVSVMDFGPTIASLLGVDLGRVDGRSFIDRVHAR